MTHSPRRAHGNVGMNLRNFREHNPDAQWRARLSILRNAPAPNLERGRAHIVALAQKKRAPKIPTQVSFAFALGVGLAVILVMVAMTSAMGALPMASVAMTRTDVLHAHVVSPNALPANALTRAPQHSNTARVQKTPLPNIVPEPPRSPSSFSTQTFSP